MGAQFVKGGSPQFLAGKWIWDSADVQVDGTFNTFGDLQNINDITQIVLHTNLNAVLNGMVGGALGAVRIFQLGVSAAAGQVTFAHNNGAAAAGNRFFNSVTAADFIMNGNGTLVYTWGPVRNLGNFWQSQGAP